MSDDIAQWDAAYVLGALSHEDRHAYEGYLAANPERAAALIEVTDVTHALNALSREEAVALIEPRRRLTHRTLASATLGAAAANAIGAGVGSTPFSASAPRQTGAVALTAMQSTAHGGINAALAVTAERWGTRLDWTCEYTAHWAKKVASYDIVVTTAEGVECAVGAWNPAGDQTTGLAAWTPIPVTKIRSVDIRVSGTEASLAIITLR
jgi:hypothetical protein